MMIFSNASMACIGIYSPTKGVTQPEPPDIEDEACESRASDLKKKSGDTEQTSMPNSCVEKSW